MEFLVDVGIILLVMVFVRALIVLFSLVIDEE